MSKDDTRPVQNIHDVLLRVLRYDVHGPILWEESTKNFLELLHSGVVVTVCAKATAMPLIGGNAIVEPSSGDHAENTN